MFLASGILAADILIVFGAQKKSVFEIGCFDFGILA
jgi:hypothetical protein